MRKRSFKKKKQHPKQHSKHRHPTRSKGQSEGRSEQYLGRIQKHRDGFGFILSSRPQIPDAFLPREVAQQYLQGDVVYYRMVPDHRGFRADSIRLIERGQKEVVGILHREGKHFWVQDLDEQLFWVEPGRAAANPLGQYVLAEIIDYPQRGRPARVRVLEALGKELLPKHDERVTISKFGLRTEFSTKTEPYPLQSTPERKDLCDHAFVTIDGEDAKDFDDAILVESVPQGFKLSVAIADVSYFVRPNDAIDKEAVARGTSVYFPGRAIPMLPEILSNDLCSLRPREMRLALVAEILYDKNGNALNSQFYEAMIQTKARLTYKQVHLYFNNDPQTKKELEFLDTPLKMARALFRKMLELRDRRGVLDFELSETKVEVDSQGNPVEIHRMEHWESHRLIEEFMIAANSVVAKKLRESNAVALYRVHEPPKEESLDEINALLKGLGFHQRLTDCTPIAISKILKETKGKKGAYALHKMLLRTQKQAHYFPEPKGHFGLALKDYTHFTSPIRRYPDLIVHRALKHVGLKGHSADKEIGKSLSIEELGQLTSLKERIAMESERFLVRRKECWYLRKFLGKELEGTISGVIQSGLFVELDPTGIEGFVPIDELPGSFRFDEDHRMLVADRQGLRFSLGDRLKCLVASIDVDLGRIGLKP